MSIADYPIGSKPCPKCFGTGVDQVTLNASDGAEAVKCLACDGSGVSTEKKLES